jgi:hypothetical protein
VSFVNSSNCGNAPVCFEKIYYTWHDSDNNGGWEICESNECEPDFRELQIVVRSMDSAMTMDSAKAMDSAMTMDSAMYLIPV